MTPGSENEKQRVTIILHSGFYDRVSYAMSLAAVCLVMGMEVHVLATYGGIKRFVKGHLEDREEMDAQIAGSIQKGLASGGIQPVQALLSNVKILGLKLYACPNAMANLNIARQELIEEVDEVMGLASFVQLARNASINWYI